MKKMMHIFSFEYKILWRSNMLKALLCVIFGAGIYGIFFGKFEIDKQQARINQVQQQERQQFDSLLVWASLDTLNNATHKEKYLRAVTPAGVGWEKHFTFFLTNEAPPAAGLCLGQRDIYPTYYGINVTDLSRQANVGELANPMKLLTGNFDLSYVFIFLFPLLVVALTYNLYAGEKEGGTLPLLQSQATSLRLIFISKWLIRLAVVWGLAALLLLSGFLLQGISLAAHGQLFFQWLLIVLGYSLLWMLLMAVITGLRRGAALSAILGLGCWLVFTLIIPALINLFVLASDPLPNRAEVTHAIRALNDQIWKSPRAYVFDKFYTMHPEYNDGDTADFSKWYYAGFTLLDAEANRINAMFDAQVSKRNALAEKWAWLAPAALVHDRLSQLAGTDRESQLKFRKELELYHEELRAFYYSRIYKGQHFSRKDLQALESKL